MSYSVAISVLSLGGEGKGGILDANMTFVRPKRQKKNPIPATNYAVKYATARGHLTMITNQPSQNNLKRYSRPVTGKACIEYSSSMLAFKEVLFHERML